MNTLLSVIAAIGGLSGVATLITALANLKNTSKTAAQFSNNGGSSAKDAWDRIEARLDTAIHEIAKNTVRIEETNARAAEAHSKMWTAINRRPRRRR